MKLPITLFILGCYLSLPLAAQQKQNYLLPAPFQEVLPPEKDVSYSISAFSNDKHGTWYIVLSVSEWEAGQILLLVPNNSQKPIIVGADSDLFPLDRWNPSPEPSTRVALATILFQREIESIGRNQFIKELPSILPYLAPEQLEALKKLSIPIPSQPNP